MKIGVCASFFFCALAAINSARADDTHPIIAPTALLQTDFQAHPQDEEGDTGFSLARFRLGAYSNPTDWLLVLAQAEFIGGEAPSVLDAYVRAGPWHDFRLTIGYSRSPLFVSARNELDGMAPFPELSMPVKALWPGRDLGVEVHYTPARLPLEAWLRVGNGNPDVTENDNDSFAFTGRVDATIGRGRIDTKGQETFGLRLGVGAMIDDTYDRSGVAGTIANGFEFYRPPTVRGARRVVEGHALVYAGPLRMLFETGGAMEARSVSMGSPTGPRQILDPEISRGSALEVAWMITGEKRVSSVWPVTRSKNPFSFSHPAIEIGARAERLDVGLGMRDFASSGAWGGAFTANAWLNSFIGVTLAGYVYRYDQTPVEEPMRHDSWMIQSRLTIYLNPPPLGPIGMNKSLLSL